MWPQRKTKILETFDISGCNEKTAWLYFVYQDPGRSRFIIRTYKMGNASYFAETNFLLPGVSFLFGWGNRKKRSTANPGGERQAGRVSHKTVPFFTAPAARNFVPMENRQPNSFKGELPFQQNQSSLHRCRLSCSKTLQICSILQTRAHSGNSKLSTPKRPPPPKVQKYKFL